MEESQIIIHQKIAAKRKARERWQLTRAPQDKQYYNKLAKELKHLLRTHKNESIQNYLQELTPTAASSIFPRDNPPTGPAIRTKYRTS